MSRIKRSRGWDDLVEKAREQWEGFPPEVRGVAERAYRLGKPAAGRVVTYVNNGRPIAKEEVRHELGKLPVIGGVWRPKKKRKGPKSSYWDMILSKKEQKQMRKIPEYFKDPKEKN